MSQLNQHIGDRQPEVAEAMLNRFNRAMSDDRSDRRLFKGVVF